MGDCDCLDLWRMEYSVVERGGTGRIYWLKVSGSWISNGAGGR